MKEATLGVGAGYKGSVMQPSLPGYFPASVLCYCGNDCISHLYNYKPDTHSVSIYFFKTNLHWLFALLCKKIFSVFSTSGLKISSLSIILQDSSDALTDKKKMPYFYLASIEPAILHPVFNV